jgi:hypothetical protein
MSQPQSALSGQSAAEKGVLLDELLAARPDLRAPAEILAAQRMSSEDSSAVACRGHSSRVPRCRDGVLSCFYSPQGSWRPGEIRNE